MTGSGSRTAAAQKPTTSDGFEGATTFKTRNHHAPVSTLGYAARPKARASAVARPDDERTLRLAVGHVAALWEFIGDVVETNRYEVREHDFRDRLQAGHRRAHRGAQEWLFEIGVSRTRSGPNCSRGPTVA